MLALILIVGAELRFQNVAAIQHNVDHAYPIWQALMTIERGVWPVTAQGTSVLFANPPLTGYLFIPWIALTHSPIAVYLFVITLNTAAIWLAYRATVMILDERRALIAALLMAVNPWVIEYSRTTWVQALIPFFACLVFWLLIPILLNCATRPGRRMLLALVALTAMTETYLLAFMILAPVAILFVLFRKRLPWRAVAAGLLIFCITTAIYGAGLAANATQTLSRVNDFAGSPSHLSAEAWTHAVRLISGENYAISRGMDAPINDFVLREHLSEAVHYLILAALLLGIGSAGIVLWRRQAGADRAAIALVWFALPILLMTYVSKPVHPFYLLLTLPAGYVLAAWGSGLLIRWRWGAMAVLIAAVPISILLAINTVRFAQETTARPGMYQLSALPVGVGIDMAHTLIPADARKRGAVVFSEIEEWVLDSFAGDLLLTDKDTNSGLITFLPQGGSIYLLFGSPTQALPPAPIHAENAARFYFADETFVQRYEVSVGAPDTPIPIKSNLGISYLATEIQQPLQADHISTILTYWRIDALESGRDAWLLGPFVHVYDATGKRVLITSGTVIPGAQWRLGDVHIQRIDLPIPADAAAPFTLQIGQYDGVHNLNAIFVLPDGTSNAAITVHP